MASRYHQLLQLLAEEPRTWLITGVAGFIGSHILETLLESNQRVIGLDDLSTGDRRNLEVIKNRVPDRCWSRFRFIQGSICNRMTCQTAVSGVDYILHQAALGSVPRSLRNPVATNSVNVDGFIKLALAARDQGVQRLVYASSSAVYGDEQTLPKSEGCVGKPLSPYAVTKRMDEIYAGVFHDCYGLSSIGLRYFNVFGARQDPNGPYAAVIPRWALAMINNDDVEIYGDGETSRDFCYVDNAVQASILAACASPETDHDVYNVAVGDRTSLNRLFELLRNAMSMHGISYDRQPIYREFRSGDVRHSQADISRIQQDLGYQPSHRIEEGIYETAAWYALQAIARTGSASG